MGQKIHPIGFRIGVIRDADSKWFYDRKQYGVVVAEDATIRKAIRKRWSNAGIARVEIERAADRVKVTLHSARPGAIIGRGGKGIDEVNSVVTRISKRRQPDAKVYVNVNEVRQPDVDAQLVAENIASQLERRISHRRAMRQSIMRAIRLQAKGIKVMCSGRLGGAEMARREVMKDGKIPLQTLRADVDYGQATGFTIYGAVGVKVWIYKGEVLPEKARHGQMELREREITDRPARAQRGGGRGRGRGDDAPSEPLTSSEGRTPTPVAEGSGS